MSSTSKLEKMYGRMRNGSQDRLLKHSTDATEQYETNITDKSKAQAVAEIFD